MLELLALALYLAFWAFMGLLAVAAIGIICATASDIARVGDRIACICDDDEGDE